MPDNLNTNCEHSDEIVAYMYNELGSIAKRRAFEDHLVECTPCTDEFALVSDARYSVFEWHKEEFAHLPTPEITIPYRDQAESAGFFAAIGAVIQGSGWPALAAASLLIVAGLAFGIMLMSDGRNEVAHIDVQPIETLSDVPMIVDLDPEPEHTEVELPKPAPTVVQERTQKRPPAMTRSAKRLTPRNSLPPEKVNPRPDIGKAPVLSSYEDNEDKSLRLADLLDEFGG